MKMRPRLILAATIVLTQISLGACADASGKAPQSAAPAGGYVVTSDRNPVRLGGGEPVNWNGKGQQRREPVTHGGGLA